MFLPTTDIYVEPVENCTINIQLSETLTRGKINLVSRHSRNTLRCNETVLWCAPPVMLHYFPAYGMCAMELMLMGILQEDYLKVHWTQISLIWLQFIINAYPCNRYWLLGSSTNVKLCSVFVLWLKWIENKFKKKPPDNMQVMHGNWFTSQTDIHQSSDSHEYKCNLMNFFSVNKPNDEIRCLFVKLHGVLLFPRNAIKLHSVCALPRM